jgi:hypothetical protein
MDKKAERRMKYMVTGGITGIVILASTASWYGSNREYEEKSRLNTAIIKADTNRDGILQNSELVSMLKRVGCLQPIPENSNPLIQPMKAKGPTYVDYEKTIDETFSSRQQGVTVYFAEKDIQNYLSQK